ncbi:MAG: Oligopeptide transport ATP-binding protein OppD [Syntrophomonadaceae bacterium]|nr:Oligopeptide transport ATP-binding protein OppD [Bacillota bacterium]
MALLSVKDLKVHFNIHMGSVKAVDGVSYDLEKGKTLGIVGESGSGKTVSCLSLLKLIQMPPGKIAGGEAIFEGKDLLSLREVFLREVRGNKISMIFQEPMTTLNPVYTIGEQIGEVLRLHKGLNKREAFKRAVEMLELVAIPLPQARASSYPHQLSGGMRQRAMIAMAMSCQPQILIADEPTTALDVTIQAQILDLIHGFKVKFKTAVILITHNMGVISAAADDVLVMYVGKMLEKGEVFKIFDNPKHPYTQGLLGCILKPAKVKNGLKTMPGFIPNPVDKPQGCVFSPRCTQRKGVCMEDEPPLVSFGEHKVACWLYA